MSTVKLIKGLKNIHFAPYVDGAFQEPQPILFAKKIENSLNYESETEWADDRIVDSSSSYNGGAGTLSVLGLTAEEQALLFGNTFVKGGIAVKDTDIAPQGAFLFERGKKGSRHKRLYVIYACTCSPTGVSGETVQDGKASATEESISYSIGSDNNGNIYHYVDTDDTTADQEAIGKWYEEVQFPTPRT